MIGDPRDISYIPIPTRYTRVRTPVEPLPGAENLGEADDIEYFKNKLFNALELPQCFFGGTVIDSLMNSWGELNER